MPTDWQFRVANRFHQGILGLSKGRLGGKISGMPVLGLTTTGRKSGRSHAVMLTSPLQEGENVVLVASRGGDDHHPAWYHNLKANPHVSVAVAGRPTKAMRARVAGSDERGRLWPLITARSPIYAGYQKKTDRQIPVVVLEPLVPSA